MASFSRWGSAVGRIETRASNKAQGQRCDLKVDKIEILLEANLQICSILANMGQRTCLCAEEEVISTPL